MGKNKNNRNNIKNNELLDNWLKTNFFLEIFIRIIYEKYIERKIKENPKICFIWAPSDLPNAYK